MTNKDKPDIDPKQLARANELIDNLGKEAQVDEEQKEWIDASLEYGHNLFWEGIKTAENTDMAMSPILSTFMRHSALCMAWDNKYHQDELYQNIEGDSGW